MCPEYCYLSFLLRGSSRISASSPPKDASHGKLNNSMIYTPGAGLESFANVIYVVCCVAIKQVIITVNSIVILNLKLFFPLYTIYVHVHTHVG